MGCGADDAEAGGGKSGDRVVDRRARPTRRAIVLDAAWLPLYRAIIGTSAVLQAWFARA